MAMESDRRLEPVTDPEDPKVAALLEAAVGTSGLGVIPDFHRVLANHPEVFHRIVTLGLGRLPDGELTVRQRELLVLRTSRRCSAIYEWAHHRRRATERGLAPLDVALAWFGPEAASDELDRILLQTADDLHDHATISDRAWESLLHAVGAAAAIEAITVVGWFHMIAFLGNALDVQIEAGVDGRFAPPESDS